MRLAVTKTIAANTARTQRNMTFFLLLMAVVHSANDAASVPIGTCAQRSMLKRCRLDLNQRSRPLLPAA
jgi:hypothetical protein